MAEKQPPENPAPAEETQPTEKKKRGLPKVAVIAIVVLAQVAVAYFLQKALFFNTPVGAAESASQVEEKSEETEPESEPDIVMLDELIVNPADTGGRRYLAVTIGLSIKAKESTKEPEKKEEGEGGKSNDVFGKKQALIRDALISLLSSKHLDQLADIGYRDSLKTEIKDAVNRQIKDHPVENVIFTSYVLQ